MNLKATRTEEIIVDASELQEQINNLSFKINNLPSYSFDETELTNKISNYVLIFSVINLLSIAVVFYFLIKAKKTI